MRILFQRWRIQLVAACALLCGLSAAIGAETNPAPRAFKVTYQSFRQTGDGEDPQQAVASLAAAPGWTAQLLPAPGDLKWREAPAETKPEEWFSLVKVKNGRACDFLGFVFADEQGTVAYAAHRPSWFRPVQYWFAVRPGPDQIPMNAIREVATDFLYEFDAVRAAPPRPRLTVKVKAWEEAQADKQELITAGSEATFAPLAAQELAGIEALTFAAAYEAGWQPTAGDADSVATLDIRSAMSLYFALRIALKMPDRQQHASRTAIPREQIYPHLVRVMRSLTQPDDIRDFGFLGSPEARLLTWLGDAFAVLDGSTIKALDSVSGKTRWAFTDPQKTARYAVRGGSEGRPVLYRYDWRISRIDPSNGVNQALAPVNAKQVDLFDVAADGAVAAISNTTLRLYRGDNLLWTFEGDGAECRPVFSGNRLYTASSAGTIYCLVPAEKKVVWKSSLAAPVIQPIVPAGEVVCAIGAKRLWALRASDGKPAWEFETGDALLGPPAAGEGGLIVASKANRIWLLDPASGKVKASANWPTWLTGFAVFDAGGRRLAACADLRNRITLLDAATLKTLREYPLRAAPQPGLFFAAGAPLHWKDEPLRTGDEALEQLTETLSDKAPALLGCDRSGFVYLLPLPKL